MIARDNEHFANVIEVRLSFRQRAALLFDIVIDVYSE